MNDTQPAPIEQPRAEMDLLAALLSYLIPGLGQVYQGRILKGIIFFVCLWGLFFYGLYLGNWQSVYFPPQRDAQGHRIRNHADIELRTPIVVGLLGQPLIIPHAPYLAQFCIGIAAWPAIVQANSYDLSELPSPNSAEPDGYHPSREKGHPLLGKFERYPNAWQQSWMLRNGDKTADLGWIYTIIAGLLNILVIYDALAGAAHGTQSVPLNTTLMLLIALTGLCAVGFVAAVYLVVVAGSLQPTVYLQLPVVLVLVSLVYSATRFERWRAILLEAVHWGWRMTTFLLVIGAILYVVARPPLAVLGG